MEDLSVKTYTKKFSFVILVAFLFIVLSACQRDYYNKFVLTSAFQTTNTLEIFTKNPISKEELEIIKEEVNNILIGLDNIFNVQERYSEKLDSVLSKVSEKAGVEPVEVSEEVIFVLKKALEMSELSKVQFQNEEVALFDPTISPVWKTWDFPTNQYDHFDNILSVSEIEEIKEEIKEIINAGLVDYKKIKINEEDKTVYLEKEGMEIDLGAIAKGYAADKIKDYLVNRGYNSCIISVGGNILLVGDLFGKPFKIGIRTPYINWTNLRKDKKGKYINEAFGLIEVSDLSVVTSGTYERYIRDRSGNEYHHILHPATGLPINNNVVSITVITEESIMADGYSTTLFALGMEKGLEIVENTEGLETIWVIRNGKTFEIYLSSGLADSFSFNENVIEDGFVYKGVYNENAEN